jgi:hypothetical protein
MFNERASQPSVTVRCHNMKCTHQVCVALDAAGICMTILTTPDLDRVMVQEEMVDRCIELTKFHIVQNVLPKGSKQLVQEQVPSQSQSRVR